VKRPRRKVEQACPTSTEFRTG